MPNAAFNDRKYIILMFKAAGEDSYSTFIPTDATRLGVLQTQRPTLHFTAGELTGTALGATGFSLNPRMAPLLPLWNAGQMAITNRVGPMYDDIRGNTRQEIYDSGDGTPRVAEGIGSHDSQQHAWASMYPGVWFNPAGIRKTISSDGWAGRTMERFNSFVGPSVYPLSQQFGGNSGGFPGLIMQNGSFIPISLPGHGEQFTVNASGNPISLALQARIRTLANRTLTTRQQVYANAWKAADTASTFYGDIVQNRTPAAYSTDSSFTETGGWNDTLKMIARAILTGGANNTLPKRVLFALVLGDFDTHGTQGKSTGRLPDQLFDWASAVASFRTAMIAAGEWDNCLLIDGSDFSRTLTENGFLGTDHAYARTCFAFGSMVRGAGVDGSTGIFGDYPPVLGTNGTGTYDLIDGSLAGPGSLIPGFSLEEYHAEFLSWFGANAADLDYILPRRAVFGAPVNLIVGV